MKKRQKKKRQKKFYKNELQESNWAKENIEKKLRKFVKNVKYKKK